MAINVEQLVNETVNELINQLRASPKTSEEEIGKIIKSCFHNAFYQTENEAEQKRLFRKLGLTVHPDKLKIDKLIDALKPNDLSLLMQILSNFNPNNQLANREVTLKTLIQQVNNIASKRMGVDINYENIKLPIEIDEKELNLLINSLEKQNTPIAFLTCGLLLEGRIPNYCDEEKADLNAYLEKRTHDAISFYVKADQNNELKSMVNFLLWELNTVTDFESVRMRLSEFELLPPTDYISQYSNFKAPTRISHPSLLDKRSSLFFQIKNEGDSSVGETLDISKKPK